MRGNHDKVVAGIDSGGNFNQTALTAAQWTTGRLTPANLRYVRELPQGPLQVEEGLAICHGSPLDEDTYVFSDVDAWEIFSRFETPVTFFGHTHIPSLFWLEGRLLGVQALRGTSGRIELAPGGRYLINPGSIGQPRDRDPRASYMIYDSKRRVVDAGTASPTPSATPSPHPQGRPAAQPGRPAGGRGVGQGACTWRRCKDPPVPGELRNSRLHAHLLQLRPAPRTAGSSPGCRRAAPRRGRPRRAGSAACG